MLITKQRQGSKFPFSTYKNFPFLGTIHQSEGAIL